MRSLVERCLRQETCNILPEIMVIGGSIPTVEYGSDVWDAPERLAGAWSGEKPAFPTATQWVAHPVSSKQMRIVESSRLHRSFEVLNTSDVHRCSQMFKWVWRTSNPGHFLPFLFAPCLPNKCLVLRMAATSQEISSRTGVDLISWLNRFLSQHWRSKFAGRYAGIDWDVLGCTG